MSNEQQNGQDGGAAGGNAAPGGEAARAGQAYGTASRAPLFSQQQQPEVKPEPGAAAPAGEPGAAPKAGRGPVTTAGIPDAALKSRLDRAKAMGAEPFMKLLGAKSEAEAKDKLAKLSQLEQEGEKRRLAEMGEVERLKAELEAERQKNSLLEQQLAEHAHEREHEQHEQVVTRVASEAVDPDALPLFKMHLAQHVKKLAQTNPELAEKFGERSIKRFTEKWVQQHPKFARAPGGAEAAPGKVAPGAQAPKAAPLPVRRPVTSGAPQRRNPAPVVQQGGAMPSMANGKTARPGQANTMSSAEVKAYAASKGINYNPV